MNTKTEENVQCGEVDYEYVPPEGGWGYVVCFGLSVIFIAGTAHQPVFGFIYNDFLDELGVGTGAVTVVFGVFQVTLAIAGFSANIALKKLSLRQVGLIGATIYTLASFLAIFVVSTTQMIITNGFLQGLGMGLLIPVSYTSFNSYFTKKKVLYISLCKASIGMITMVYPLFIKFTITEYGFRGTLAILCAISAHSILGALVMHPVQWYMVKQPKVCEKIVSPVFSVFWKRLMRQAIDAPVSPEMISACGMACFVIPPTPALKEENEEKFVFEKHEIDMSNNARSAENLCRINCLENSGTGKELLFVSKFGSSRRLSIPVLLIPADGNCNSRFDSTDLVYRENLQKAVSASSLGNFSNIVAEPLPLIKNKEGKWQTMAEFLDLTLLKDIIYVNIIFGLALTFFADLTFFTVEPLFLDKKHLSKAEIANIIAVGGAMDMSARLFLGISGQFFRIKSRYMFYLGALLTAVFRLVLVQFSSYMSLMIITGILGALRSLVHIAQPIVLAEYVPIERYPPAYGLYMLLAGAISLTVGPMIGFIRDYTGSYAIAFNMLTACNICCVIPWTVEGIVKYIKNRRTSSSTDSLKTSNS